MNSYQVQKANFFDQYNIDNIFQKSGTKRKRSQTSRDRVVFSNVKRAGMSPLKRRDLSSADSSDGEDDVERASPISRNSCKGWLFICPE